MIKRGIVCGDLHGDMQDRTTVEALYAVTDKFKPDMRVFLGDLTDSRAARRGASHEERYDSSEKDVLMSLEFLKEWRPHVFALGNHDHRWAENRKNCLNGMERDYLDSVCNRINDVCIANGTRLIPYGKTHYYELCGYKFFHGSAHGIYSAKKTYQHMGLSVSGHVHRWGMFAGDRIEDRGNISYTIAALCQLEMPYNATHLGSLSQSNGFMAFVYDEDNDWIEFYPIKKETGFYHPF